MGKNRARSRACLSRVMIPPRNLLYRHPFFCDVFAVFCFAEYYSSMKDITPFGVYMDSKGKIALCVSLQKQQRIENTYHLLQEQSHARVWALVYEVVLSSKNEKKSVVRIHITHNESSDDLLFYIPTEHHSAWWVEEPSQTLFPANKNIEKN